MKNDGSGIKVSAPCYFECRFIGPNAIGTWPAFWLMTDYMTDKGKLKDKSRCDELDIIEAYGGEGPREPNAFDTYMVTPHCWNQGDAGKELETKAFKGMHNPIHMRKVGIPLDLVRDVPHLRLQSHRDRHDLLLRQHRGRPARDISALQETAALLLDQSGHRRRLARRFVPV